MPLNQITKYLSIYLSHYKWIEKQMHQPKRDYILTLKYLLEY